MRKSTIVVSVVALALVAGTAFAQMGWGGGPGMGYGRGQYGRVSGTVNVQNLKKFQKETLSLRDDLITKQAELDNEYAKDTPNDARVAELQKQIIDLRATIQQAAAKNGIITGGRGFGRGYAMGPGMMYGSGPYGYGCPAWSGY
jgi:hypothetical protein